MKIFSKEQFEKVEKEKGCDWTQKCDGRKVIGGKIGDFFIDDKWCIENENKK